MGLYVFETQATQKEAKKILFKVGDLVRISRINMIPVFDRSYDEHFTREIFKIQKRFRMQAIPI
jgi:hypothetical protein